MKKFLFSACLFLLLSFLGAQSKTHQPPTAMLSLAPGNTTIIRAWSFYRYKHPEKNWKRKINLLLKKEKKLKKDSYDDCVYIFVSFRNFNFKNPYDPQKFRLMDENKKVHIPKRYFPISKGIALGGTWRNRVDLYVYKFTNILKQKSASIYYIRKNRNYISKPFVLNNGITIEMTSDEDYQ
jgi:hypothetical protein